MYAETTNFKNVDLARIILTSNALTEHIKRVYFQVQAWYGSQGQDETLDPLEWGWELVNGELSPVTMTQEAGPEEILGKISCSCKTDCGTRCGCRRTKDSNSTIDDDPELTGREIVDELKNKFDNTSKWSEKLQILSVLPSSWSIEKIVNTFGASSYIVRKVKQKVKQDGILFIPDSNKEKYPFEKKGFSKCASLKPAECVLAGASGTHVVCVCLIHENFKLLFHGAKLDKLKLRDDSQPLSSYRDCMKMFICQEPTENCYFGTCTHCPGSIKLRTILENLFTDNFLDELKCNQWTQVDRCSLETIIKSTDDFVDFFIESIPKVLQHDFIAKQQAEYFQTVKSNLEVGQILVVADFSENYSFLLQNSVQGEYWNNTQATIHPFACYYKSIDGNESKVIPLRLIIVLENLTHNTTAVYSFQEELTSFLKTKVPNITKIIYFSNGAASQYKNRYNLVNLLYHKEDFKIPVEWHFHVTSHGKGPSDGLGGLIKRLLTRSNLQKEADQQIQTPEEMCKWGQDNLPGVYCRFVSNNKI
ncbi:unnamed protein product [Psylliodes chrysocephalus]|uniref:Cc8L18.2-like protein n=1 Tax=Psylliodes chrysocephalus TaxID=3402493 RepID=A0A9P0CXM3_9CUCU|nr:unnamed protein product [Psylliodes chrysocephala]